MSLKDDLIAELERNGTEGFLDKFSDRAVERGIFAWWDFRGEPQENTCDKGATFIVAHILAEAAALKRAAIALSDPRAHGNALAVVQALADGLDIEDALRKVSIPAPAEIGKCDENVIVPFKRT